MQPHREESQQVRLRRGKAAAAVVAANAPHTSTKEENKKQQAISRCYGAANLPQKMARRQHFFVENLNATQ